MRKNYMLHGRPLSKEEYYNEVCKGVDDILDCNLPSRLEEIALGAYLDLYGIETARSVRKVKEPK